MKHVRGMVCLALTGEQCDQLRLHSQTEHNTATLGTAFTVTVDAHPKFGVSTGISAFDRAKTIEVAIADDAQPQRPAPPRPHQPAPRPRRRRARPRRADRGRRRPRPPRRAQARRRHLRDPQRRRRRWPAGRSSRSSARSFGLKMCTIADLISYRLKREQFVKRIESVTLPTRWGEFRLHAYQSVVDPQPHLALVKGGIGELGAGRQGRSRTPSPRSSASTANA